ncbi:hypothetical protein P3H15_43600 [Rhodococcus sp. T2V]|uniref:UGSC family (seleno)protein n=1 Tax=Rhodococcus sp. T2V TaxID=3034164 RepID=UPI0023E12DF1|nr:hypothetical protein [Rhodococcus sp. T2V]MDF3311869.1 hypothetical protein [Rhodococcus sp. T2V]
MTSSTLESYAIIDPRSSVAVVEQTQSVALTTLQGKTLGIVTHGNWRSWEYFCDRLENFLSGPGQDVQHQRYQDERPYLDERYDQIVREVDAAVVGLGNCGSCTAQVATAAAQLAARGLPVLVVATEGFKSLAEMTLEYRNYPNVQVFTLPAEYEVMEERDLVRIADERVVDIESALTSKAI